MDHIATLTWTGTNDSEATWKGDVWTWVTSLHWPSNEQYRLEALWDELRNEVYMYDEFGN